MILLLIVFLIILPFLYGDLLLNNRCKNRLITIPYGFMVELALWTLVSLPIALRGGRFTTSFCLFIIMNVPILIFYIRKIQKEPKWIKQIVKDMKEHILWNMKSKIFFLMLFVIVFQCIRVTFFQQIYGDNRVYTAIVNDMVETDSFYALNQDNGAVWSNISEVPTKYLLASWYAFEAFFAKVSGIKALAIVYTVLPGYLIVLFYNIWWEIIRRFSKNNLDIMAGFLLVMSLLYEFGAEDMSSYILNWPTYGKSITANMVMPLMLLLWIDYVHTKRRAEYAVLFILMVAGCASSTMGLMFMPIEISLLYLIEIMKRRHINRTMVKQYIVLMIPIVVYVALFLRVEYGFLV